MAADLQQPADVDAAAGGAPSYLPLRFARLFFWIFPELPPSCHGNFYRLRKELPGSRCPPRKNRAT